MAKNTSKRIAKLKLFTRTSRDNIENRCCVIVTYTILLFYTAVYTSGTARRRRLYDGWGESKNYVSSEFRVVALRPTTAETSCSAVKGFCLKSFAAAAAAVANIFFESIYDLSALGILR